MNEKLTRIKKKESNNIILLFLLIIDYKLSATISARLLNPMDDKRKIVHSLACEGMTEENRVLNKKKIF